MPGQVWTIEFPQPAALISMNDRLHWSARSRLTRAWRTAAFIATRAQLRPHLPLPACIVRIDLPVADRRRRDPMNYTPTLKACVDGLVDGKAWPDDTPDYVTTVEPTLAIKAERVVITLEERT